MSDTLLDRLVQRHAALGEEMLIVNRQRAVLRQAIMMQRLGRDPVTVLALMAESEPSMAAEFAAP